MCNCGQNKADVLLPQLAVITDIKEETPDVKTFRVEKPGGGQPFTWMPGQCAIISAPGIGEAIFSITSSPLHKEYMEFSIKKCGDLTDWLHSVEKGQEIALRGPYGKPFPVEDAFKKQNLLFVAGGIGLAPLRSVIQYVFHNRNDYGTVDVVYGARSKEDLVDYSELMEEWPQEKDTKVYTTIDRPQDSWTGNVGFVPAYLEALNFSTDKTVIICGPPIMIKMVLASLIKMGFKKDQVYTTLEMRMKCGVGKCGRCNVGNKYVCKDGPVFRCDELDELPDEY